MPHRLSPRCFLSPARFLRAAGGTFLLAVAAAAAADRPVVAVGIPPLQWVVDTIAGDRVESVVLLKPGQSPHTFDPAPRQVAALGAAKAFLYIGLETERAIAARAAAQNPALHCVAVGGLAAPAAHDHAADDHCHGEDGADPHVWLAPVRMAEVATRCAAALRTILPDDHAAIGAGLARARARIDAVDADVRALLKPAAGATLLVYHPSWGHFSAAYGLKQHALEADGKTPSARHLANLVSAVRREGVRTLFSNPDAPEAVVRRAAATLGCRVEVIDPLAAAWDENLLQTARRMAAGIAPEVQP